MKTTIYAPTFANLLRNDRDYDESLETVIPPEGTNWIADVEVDYTPKPDTYRPFLCTSRHTWFTFSTDSGATVTLRIEARKEKEDDLDSWSSHPSLYVGLDNGVGTPISADIDLRDFARSRVSAGCAYHMVRHPIPERDVNAMLRAFQACELDKMARVLRNTAETLDLI